MIFLVWIYGSGQQSGMEIMNIKEQKRIYGFLEMTKHNNIVGPKKIEPMSSGHECAIGSILEGIMQYVKFFERFSDKWKNIGTLHISEVNHVLVTNMDAMFVVEGKVKVSLN